ncbi:calcium/sodium antiporter [Alkalimonas collagenimarina]|uniref:Calcium/sodium antiporter n=1 Tax=Alkalimonas collagenimarina TaxID=400390 RepID=A0ABT9GWF4_9GAMM|nr:calcium/sodium antiporter [Alkalimonas collagenimarina]MDP4535194.1 calcium/sodium antiporter [Alkalimonas collagenimarina]
MSPLITASIFVLVGLILLIWSADRFVYGASSIARNLNISPMIIGLTIVAMGSSAPEIMVSATAAWQGRLDTSVGNALGSNITNILLVIGATALLKPISVASMTVKREFPLLILCTLLGYLFLADQTLTRAEGGILLTAFALFIALMVYWGRHVAPDDPLLSEYQAELPPPITTYKAIFWLVAGLLLLLASSQLLVHGAVTIASYAGMSDLLIGLTIIAIGTSLPELAASLIGILKGEDDLALGNIIGSNIFNILAVLGIGVVIAPGSIDVNAAGRDSYVMIAATVVMLLMSLRIGKLRRINRVEGLLLLTAFIGYQFLLFNSF